jgi:YD repeat-containing protein
VLRAIVSSGDNGRPLLTFAYDDMGRLVTVGDHRDHSSYFVYRYTYDEAGRLAILEEDCTPVGGSEPCNATYEFSYAEAGWLERLVLSYSEAPEQSHTETYDEDGLLLERLNVLSWGTGVTTYQYRSDGQVDVSQSFSVDEDGVRIPDVTATYLYGDDDLVDRIECVDAASYIDYRCNERFSYTLEGERVRRRSRSWEEGELGHTIVFDDRGFPAFEHRTMQGEDDGVSVVINGTHSPAAWMAKPEPRYRELPIDESSRFLPRAVTEGVIENFSYTYNYIPFSRQVRLADDGMLDQLTATWGPGTNVEFKSLRCGGVVLETIQHGEPYDTYAAATYYYYGCDDFVLPPPPQQ